MYVHTYMFALVSMTYIPDQLAVLQRWPAYIAYTVISIHA